MREFMGKGLTAVAEVERLSPYTEFNDIRLRPLLKVETSGKKSFSRFKGLGFVVYLISQSLRANEHRFNLGCNDCL